jgi:hypothetical protein
MEICVTQLKSNGKNLEIFKTIVLEIIRIGESKFLIEKIGILN